MWVGISLPDPMIQAAMVSVFPSQLRCRLSLLALGVNFIVLGLPALLQNEPSATKVNNY